MCVEYARACVPELLAEVDAVGVRRRMTVGDGTSGLGAGERRAPVGHLGQGAVGERVVQRVERVRRRALAVGAVRVLQRPVAKCVVPIQRACVVAVASLCGSTAESHISSPKPFFGKEFETGAFLDRQSHFLEGLEHCDCLGKLDVHEALAVDLGDLVADFETSNLGETMGLHGLYKDARKLRRPLHDTETSERRTHATGRL